MCRVMKSRSGASRSPISAPSLRLAQSWDPFSLERGLDPASVALGDRVGLTKRVSDAADYAGITVPSRARPCLVGGRERTSSGPADAPGRPAQHTFSAPSFLISAFVCFTMLDGMRTLSPCSTTTTEGGTSFWP